MSKEDILRSRDYLEHIVERREIMEINSTKVLKVYADTSVFGGVFDKEFSQPS
jgi:hypothetical protein